jgi:hypothetical protein
VYQELPLKSAFSSGGPEKPESPALSGPYPMEGIKMMVFETARKYY